MSKPKARKWSVNAFAYLNQYLGEVEAATKEEATKKAEALFASADLPTSLCHQCTDKFDYPSDWDLSPVEEIK
jgi:hypothetical protein